ncbi:MAG: iron-containing alcohol dehydrogenase, partial [Clostridia bacterium]
RHGAAVEALRTAWAREGVESTTFTEIAGEPTPAMIDAALAAAQSAHCDAVVAIGGGSVLDAGKAVAGLLPNGGPVTDYLEGVGTGRRLQYAPVPYVAVPTTSGTGAEVTKNAVITSYAPAYKKSFRDERLLARLVLVDPMMTVSLSPAQTAASGMDALTQLIEAYVTRKHNPITDGMALEGIRLVAGALVCACTQGDHVQARTDMAAASLLSGLCLANAGLGAVHGIAAALGAHLGVGHGLACAMLLPHVMRVNLPACSARYAQVAQALCGREQAEAGVAFVETLACRIGIARDLRGLHLSTAQIACIARDSVGSSMNGNPLQQDTAAWMEFLQTIAV